MNRALVLLIALQARGWFRYLNRNLRTVRGAITGFLGAGFFVLWLLAVMARPEGVGIPPETLRRNGPAFLLFYCLMNVFVSTGERAVYFSPGEVNFLFAGPFGRREVLAYKIAMSFLVSLPSSLILTVILRVHAGWFLAAYIGLLLAIMFQQLFGMAINFVAITLGARAYSLSRRVLLWTIIALALAAVLRTGGPPGNWRPRMLFETMTATPAWHIASTPLRWYFDAFLAKTPAELALYAGLALAVNAVLLILVFVLDAQYLEAAATSSARLYSQTQRFRRGGMAAVGRVGTPRFSLPDLPYWGGIGPLLWRQLTTASRGLGRLAFILALIGLFVVLPILARSDDGDGPVPGALLGGLVVWLTVFLTQMVPFDFRGDVDRIAALKTLPLPAWRLALGQLMAPVLLVTGAQWATLAAARVFRPEDSSLMLTLAVFAPPFNFLLFSLENLLFLRFPVRAISTTPGDFQAAGRNLLFMMAKLAVLVTVAGGALIVGLGCGFVTWILLGFSNRFNPDELTSLALTAGGAAGWLVVTGSGLALLPIVALAFKAFDVGRDTPA